MNENDGLSMEQKTRMDDDMPIEGETTGEHEMPVGVEPSEDQEIPITGDTNQTNNQKPLLIAGVAALVVLLCCCVLFLGTLLLIDPFGLQIMDRLTGKWDAAAEAMPEDTVVYMGVNLLNMTPEKLARVLEPFQDLMTGETGEPIATLEDLKTRMDQEVLSDLDMTFAEDIQPWIGQYLGMGVVDIHVGQYGELEALDYLVSVEARSSKAADAFLEKLKTNITENSGGTFIETEYQGVTITEFSPAGESDPIALARSEKLLLFSNQTRILKTAIDDQKGGSLAAKPIFKQLNGQLPKERILSIYISGERLTELLHASSQSIGGMGIAQSYEFLNGMAMSVSIVDAGVQVDSLVSYDPGEVNAEQEAMFAASGDELKLAKLLPAGTVFYIGGTHLDLVWLANRAALAQTTGMGADWDSAMELFEQQYGFNPDTGLFPYLDGEWGLAIMPADDGILAQQMKIPLGVLLAVDTSDTDQLAGAVNGFAGSLTSMGTPVEEITVGGATLKQLTDPMMGPMVSFGLSDERLVIATSSDVVGRLTEDQETLAESERYQLVIKELPRGLAPMMYLDLEKMLGDIRSGLSAEMLGNFEESVNYLKPVQYVLIGNSAVKNNLAHGVAIIFIQPR